MGELPLLDTIAAEVRTEQEVSRSRFIATLAPVADLDAVGEVVARVRREFHDASHHCTALVLGPDGQQQRSNDDGEPAGTAGAPMLAVLRGAELTDVVAVVTRHFGGTLLGAGGLVRAYGGAVSAACDRARRLARRWVTVVRIDVPLADAGRIEHLLHRFTADVGIPLEPGAYTADGATFHLAVPDGGAMDHLEQLLAVEGLPRSVERLRREVRDVAR
ncbi:MAG: YigZ family protein [Nitriliruptoraceae bacterium]